MDLELSHSARGEAVVVSISGELDALAASQLDSYLTQLVAERPALLVADLTSVDFLDSTGLGVLIKSLTSQRENNGDLAVVAPPGRVRKVLDITGMDQVMNVADSVADALGEES